MSEKETYISRTREMAAGAKELTDDQLREMFSGLEIGRLRCVDEVREVVGEEVMFADVLMILGAERGLWDQAGYRKEPTQKVVDPVFSRRCEEKIHALWGNQDFPLLVFFILGLKFGIRRIDDRGLIEIARMVNGPWLFRVPQTNELLEWRLTTLRYALAAVLSDRGYDANRVESNHV